MRRVLTACVLASALAAAGCSPNRTSSVEGEYFYPAGCVEGYRVRTATIDGCEYLVIGCGNALTVTHKGNCKYCRERAAPPR